MPASIWRRIHARLLNMAVLSLPLKLVAWIVGPLAGAFASSIGLLAVSILLPGSLSPGHRILGIQPDHTVDDEILSGESWITLVLGFLFVDWGTTSIVLWARYDFDKVPIFGALVDPAFGSAIFMSWGMLTVLTGILFYKLSPVALWFGIAIVLVNAVDLFFGRSAWIELVLTRVVAEQAPDGPLAGMTFSAPTIAAETGPIFGILLGTGSALAIAAMVLSSGRLTRTS
jgi:hypothetical protein